MELKIKDNVSPYEKIHRKKNKKYNIDQLTKQNNISDRFTYHAVSRISERLGEPEYKVISDISCALRDSRVMYCRIYKVFKIYWRIARYIISSKDYNIITLYDIDREKEKSSNKRHDWISLSGKQMNKLIKNLYK